MIIWEVKGIYKELRSQVVKELRQMSCFKFDIEATKLLS